MKELNTERLVIRNFLESDGEDLFEYLSDQDVVEFEPYKVFSREGAYLEAKRRAEDNTFYAVCLKSGKVIGNLYFAESEFSSWEVGYVFNKKFWGSGYATESLKALMDYAFNERKIHRLVAYCDPKNPHSWELLERVGMRREGTFLQNVYFFQNEIGSPIWKDSYEYAILEKEFKN